MRLDRLPIDMAVIGFLLTAIVVTFAVAFTIVESDEGAPSETTAPTGSPGPTGSAPPGQLAIAMHDNSFDPDSLTVPAGETVTINVTNEGVAIHNVHIADEAGDYADSFCDASAPGACSDPNRVGGGQSATVTWTVPNTPGAEIPFRCDFHPVEMKGTITIQ